MRYPPNLFLAALLFAAPLAQSAGERGEIRTVAEGLIFVPEKIGINAPVIVLVEEQGRARQVLDKITWALTRECIPAIAPLLRKESEKLSGASAWPQTEALLRRLEAEYQISGRNLYAFGFSASGAAAYDLAFSQPTRFKGVIAAATFPPQLPKPISIQHRKLRILLVAPDGDEFFGVEQNKKTMNLLKAEGFDATLKTVTGNHFSPLEKHADLLLRWAAGGRSLPATTVSTSGDDQKSARVTGLQPRWSKPLLAGILAPPVPARDFLVVLTDDGRAHLLASKTGEILRSIPLFKSEPAPALRRRTAAGRLFGTLLVLPVQGQPPPGDEPTRLLGVDLKDDRVLWEVTSSASISSSVGGRGSLFGYSTHDGFYHVRNVTDGTEKWSASAGTSCASSGWFLAERVFFSGTAGVFAYETLTGNKIWETGLPCSPNSDTLALSTEGDSLFAATGRQAVGLDPQTGSKLWQLPLDGDLTCAPCYVENCFVVATPTSLVAISKKGARVWTRPLTRPIPAPLQPLGRFVLLISGEGQLVAIRTDTGAPMAASQEKLDPALGLAVSGFYCVGVTTAGAVVCYDLSSL